MKKVSLPKRGDVYWVNLDPTIGTEINKKRPAVIVSNDTGNEYSNRVIVAPITSQASKIFPFDVAINVKNKTGKALIDQIRSIDKIRLDNKIDHLDSATIQEIDIALKKVLALK